MFNERERETAFSYLISFSNQFNVPFCSAFINLRRVNYLHVIKNHDDIYIHT